MRSQVGPAAKELKTVEDYEAFVDKIDVAAVAFLPVSIEYRTLTIHYLCMVNG